jgi:hypothetical protein
VGAGLDRLWASHLSWAAPLGIVGDLANAISRGPAAAMLSMTWLLGTTLMFVRLCLRIRAERSDAQATARLGAREPRPGFRAQGVLVRFAGSGQAPGVTGFCVLISHSPTGLTAC